MSKLFANAILKEYDIDVEVAREKMKSMPVRMKYTKSTGNFTITCFNFFLFAKYSTDEKEKIVVSEQDLMRLVKADSRWTDYDKKDLSKDSRFIKAVEKDGTDLAINHYWAICFIQRYFTLTPYTLKEAKREYHKYRLKRVKEPWIELSPIPANRHGGRPFGSVKKLTEEEHERLLYNLENYKTFVKKYVERDFLDRFVELHQDLRKLPPEELPDLLKRKFMRTDAGVKWYFFALRYEFKAELGIPDKKINPNRVAITAKSKTYDFPFKYKRDSLDFNELIRNYDELSEEYVKNGQIDEFVQLHKDLGKCEKLPSRLFFIKRSSIELFKLLFYIADCYLNDKVMNNWDAFKALKYYCTVKNPIFMKYYDLLSDETKQEIEEKQRIRAIKERMKDVGY